MPIRDEAINIFMGMPGEELPELELTHNYGVDDYELGTATGGGGGGGGGGGDGYRVELLELRG